MVQIDYLSFCHFVNTLSEWVKSIRSFIRSRIRKLKGSMKTKVPFVFNDPKVNECLSSLNDRYVIVPADKAANNFVFVCKDYYYKCLIDELGSTNAYTATSLTKEEILQNHQSVISSFGIEYKEDNLDLVINDKIRSTYFVKTTLIAPKNILRTTLLTCPIF